MIAWTTVARRALLLAFLALSACALRNEEAATNVGKTSADWAARTERQLPDTPVLIVNSERAAVGTQWLAADRAGRRFVTVASDDSIHVWNATSHQVERVIRLPRGALDLGAITAVAVSDDGSRVVAGWKNGYVGALFVCNAATGEVVAHQDGLLAAVTTLRYAPGSRVLAAGFANGDVSLFSADLARRFHVVNHVLPSAQKNTLDFDAAGERLVAGGNDGRVEMFSVDMQALELHETTRVVPSPKFQAGGQAAPAVVRFSPNGRFVAVGSRAPAST